MVLLLTVSSHLLQDLRISRGDNGAIFVLAKDTYGSNAGLY